MCPEDHILSAFYDNELDRHQSESLSHHIETCETCRNKVYKFSGISSALQTLPASDSNPSFQRTYDRIQNKITLSMPFWQRNIQIPAPFAFAATAAIIVLTVGLILTMQRAQASSLEGMTDAQFAQYEFPDIEAVLRNLGEIETSMQVSFTLPSEPILKVVSKPTMMRKADFQRGR